MINKNGSLVCDSCHKEILLRVTLQEGKIEFYCPRCHHYQKIQASTAQVKIPLLTNSEKAFTMQNISK